MELKQGNQELSWKMEMERTLQKIEKKQMELERELDQEIQEHERRQQDWTPIPPVISIFFKLSQSQRPFEVLLLMFSKAPNFVNH